jgi:2,4-dienoyl-CoA reductase-like NADH-dependent reductase (Old Yellow Enzyme family)
MSKLFEKTTVNGMELNNRFVRSATWEGMAAEDGTCTDHLEDLMVKLAQGNVGLIISSHAYIRKDGQAGPGQLGIYKDEQVEALKKMTAAVHKHGGKIVLQLAHAGFFAHPGLTGQAPMALSRVEGFARGEREEMSDQFIKELVNDFGAAGRRARDAGFDGVQLHAAHGYLLSQSLSPAFNKRKEPYGGSLENRARLTLDVMAKLREKLGNDYPILIKMNSEDFIKDGLSQEEALIIARLLQDGGIDAIEVSGGTFLSGSLIPSREKISSEDREAYFREAGKRFRESLRIPVILVGGIRSIALAEKLLEDGVADYFSMSRPFIREPDLIKRWMSGDLRRATCVSDNQCFKPARTGEGIYCVVEKKSMEKGKDK